MGHHKTKNAIILVSSPFHLYYKNVIDLVHAIVETTDASIYVGGHDATVNITKYRTDLPATVGIIPGAGEAKILNLIQKLTCSQETDSRQDQDYPPSRVFLETMRREYGTTLFPEAAMYSSRGCLWNCSFCSVALYRKCTGEGLYLRSEEAIANEMQMLNLQGIKKFNFVDDMFILPGSRGASRLSSLSDLIIEKNISVDSMKITTRIDRHIKPLSCWR